MISHALVITRNELHTHLHNVYGPGNDVDLGNFSEGMAPAVGGVKRDSLILSVINIKEEKTLKNLPNYVRDDVKMTASYQNPPVFINLLILLSATHTNYHLALTSLSRAIRFFQYQHVFTQENVSPASINTLLVDVKDRLSTF